jgi:hypothetical protein
VTATALQRAIGRAAARRTRPVERCGLCAAVVADQHRHLLDDVEGGVLCACPACALLFDRGGGDGRYLLIPRDRKRLSHVDVAALDVPVGLAFFVKQTNGAVLAHYPSPLGTTQSQVDPDAWLGTERSSPPLASMRPRVEAYLVRASTAPGRDEYWILPVDDCFRLVAVIRGHWTGMAGGSVVWREVARFFADLNIENKQEERWQGSG